MKERSIYQKQPDTCHMYQAGSGQGKGLSKPVLTVGSLKTCRNMH